MKDQNAFEDIDHLILEKNSNLFYTLHFIKAINPKASHTLLPPRIHCKNNDCRGIFLKDYIEERAVEIANYIIDNSATVRQTAKQFGISKSTVHKDVTERLLQINPALAGEARKVLDMNKSERHIRGGLATREKYLHQH
ncbi:MAG: sporulation transcriptional regulator SpoIIID [Citrobacter sp.]|nr:sporulation transcriptional regulator SpoIIID [Citrobacter sp.]MDU7777410.1 sporulation transcriptional regulator SpoIIID [Citrobacter sp.]